MTQNIMENYEKLVSNFVRITVQRFFLAFSNTVYNLDKLVENREISLFATYNAKDLDQSEFLLLVSSVRKFFAEQLNALLSHACCSSHQ